MIKSMTAFGRGKFESEKLSLTVEMKSVNSRFFDCSVKLPRAYLYLEEKIKSFVQKNATSRGKVDIYITQDIRSSDIGEISVDLELASKYIEALRTLRDSFGLCDDISVMSVARNQEIFKSVRAETDTDEDWQIISTALGEAIAGYLAMREAEGERIMKDITAKLENLLNFINTGKELRDYPQAS